jgi:molybdopterin converting factor subunit 1
MKTVHVLYFAKLREERGLSSEKITTAARTALELWEELRQKHGFSVSSDFLKVAINEQYCDFTSQLAPMDKVVFIPPVAGG